MPQTSVAQALQILRQRADRLINGFPEVVFTKLAGPGPAMIKLQPWGGFEGLKAEPGATIVLSAKLELPAESHGVRIAGEKLVATLGSLYPTEVRHNGRAIFKEGGVPVAAGPALFDILPKLKAGDNGTLEFRIHIPRHQTTTWVNFKLTTPSLRAAFEAVDVAWAQLAMANALAATPTERRAVQKAAALISQDSALSTQRFASLAAALTPLANKIKALHIHCVGHSHIDMNWLWTYPDTVQVVLRDFRAICGVLRDYPEFRFSHSQAATYEICRQHDPKLFEQVQQYIKAGRWEVIASTWVENDGNMTSGEAHVRQLLEGMRYCREHLGVSPTTYHAPDTFGHAGNLPQLAASAGDVRYYHHRANPGGVPPWPAYWWEGQDGSRILAISTPGYNGDINARDLADAALRAIKAGHRCAMHFHGIGDHGGGPSRQNLDNLRRFAANPLLPAAFCSTTAAYTNELLAANTALLVHRGESGTIFEGCYTTHADTKRANRHGENLLTTADTLAALTGINRTAALQEAWRKVLFHQFHDILDGSAIHEAYEMTATDFAAVQATAAEVCDDALDVLHAGIPAGRIAVTNPLAFDRTDIVIIPKPRIAMRGWSDGVKAPIYLVGAHGHVTIGQRTDEGLIFAAKVPALSTVSYQITDKLPPGIQHSEFSIQNSRMLPTFAHSPFDWASTSDIAPTETPFLQVHTPFFRALVRRDSGIVVDLLDKRVNRQLVGYGTRHASDYLDTARPDLALGVLTFTQEAPHGMSAWEQHEVHTEQYLIGGATTKVIESGPVRTVLETTHHLRASTITQRTIFYRDLPRIDYHTDIDWLEVGNETVGVPGLKVAFNAHLPEAQAWFETPFAAVQRPADGTESPALRWADVGGDTYGIAVLNDSKYGHDAMGNRLRLTLLRSGYEPDAISDVGRHSIAYSLLAHPGNWRDADVVRHAAGFNQPLLARVVATPTAKKKVAFRPALAAPANIQLACLKRAHYGSGTIVRVYESAGRAAECEVTGLPPRAKVYETNVVEDRQTELSANAGRVRLTLRPWQVRTILVAG